MKYTSLAEAIRSICGQQRTITDKSPVFGGDINEAFRLTLDDGTSLFMKANAPNLLPAFEAEEAGLQAIAGTGAIGTVRVLGIGTDPGGFSFLLQEFVIPGKKNRDYWERLGAELYAMHRAPRPSDNSENKEKNSALGLTTSSVPGDRKIPGQMNGSPSSGTAGCGLSSKRQRDGWIKGTGNWQIPCWSIWTSI